MQELDEVSFISMLIIRISQGKKLSLNETLDWFNTHHLIENFILPCFEVLKRQSFVTVQNEVMSILENGNNLHF